MRVLLVLLLVPAFLSLPPSEAREQVIGSLLRELGSQLRRGHRAAHCPGRPLPTGLPSIDELVGGGLPGGKQ